MDLFGNKRVPNKAPGFTGFNPYSAGIKHYGGGRSAPNVGAVSGQGLTGYNERDQKAQARKNVLMRRLKGQGTGNPMSPQIMTSDWRGGY